MAAATKKKVLQDDSPMEDRISDALGKMGKIEPLGVTNWLSTGVSTLDYAIGTGWPLGRVVEVFGPEAVRKTELAMAAVRQAQSVGGNAVWLAGEEAPTKERLAITGVSQIGLDIRTPKNLEQAMDAVISVTHACLESPTPVVIVLDSIASFSTQAELEAETLGDNPRMASAAAIISRAFTRLDLAHMAASKVLVVLVNQMRSNIGRRPWDLEYTTPGGRALGYYASVRVKMSASDYEPEGVKVPKGSFIRFQVIKNKVGPHGRKAMGVALHDRGFDDAWSCIQFLKKPDTNAQTCFNMRGAYIQLQEGLLIQGFGALYEQMHANPEVYDFVRNMVKEYFQRL